MTTSLAAQLKQIARDNAFVANLKAVQKQRPSFWFAPDVARDMDIDTVYAIGVNGLLELARLDARFAPFEDTLFSESFRNYDRSLKTPDENSKLDALLHRFLQLLSPHFLMKPAGKAFEWLLWRFQIAEYNLDDVIACAFPYHETTQFVKVCKLIRAEHAGKWSFLVQNIAKKNLPLDRTSLVHQMKKQANVLQFICKMIRDALEANISFVALHSFFTASMLAFLDAVPSVDENLVLGLLPTLTQCLRAKENAEVQLAAYMILAKISDRTVMTADMCSSLLSILTRHASNLKHALMCVLALVQKQDALTKLSLKTVTAMEAFPDLLHTLSKFSVKYDTNQLLSLLMDGFLHAKRFTVLRATLDEIRLEDGVAERLLASVFDQLLSTADLGDQEEQQELQQVFGLLQTRYSPIMDRQLKARLEAADDQQQRILELVLANFRGTRHELIVDTQTTLSLGLCHPEPSVRLASVQKLLQTLSQQEPLSEQESEFMKNALLDRLMTDDDDRILSAILSFEGLLDRVGVESLLKPVSNILQKRSQKLATLAASLLCKKKAVGSDQADAIANVLFPWLLVTENSSAVSLAVLGKLAKNKSKSEILHAVADVSIQSTSEVNRNVVSLLAKSNVSSKLILSFTGSKSVAAHFLALFVLSERISALNDEDEKLGLAKEILSRLTFSQTREKSLEISEMEAELFSGKLDCTTLSLFALHRIIKAIPQRDHSTFSWMSEAGSKNAFTEIILQIFQLCAERSLLKTLQDLVEQHAKENLLSLLALIATCENRSECVRVVAIQMIKQLVRLSMESGIDFQILLPSMLIAFSSPKENVRSSISACLDVLLQTYAGIKSKKKKSLKMFGLDTFYGGNAKKDLLFLSVEDVQSFLVDLKREQSAMVADAGHIKAWLTKVLGTRSKNGEEKSANILASLVSHVIACDQQSFRANLLELLDGVDNRKKAKSLAPILAALTPQCRAMLQGGAESESTFRLYRLLLRSFGKSCTSLLESKKSQSQAFFAALEALGKAGGTKQDSRFSLLLADALECYEAVFPGVEEDVQSKLFAVLVDWMVAFPAVSSERVGSVFQRMSLSSDLLIKELSECVGQLSGSQEDHIAKKSSSDKSSRTEIMMQRATAIIEQLQTKENIVDEAKLIPVLFEFVGQTLTITTVSTEYPRQIALGSILQIMQRAEDRKIQIEESCLRVDILVQTIRVSDNPQTHNQALLLLAAIGSLYPEKVLHSMMPVFTFMGTSILRQDDNYSFHVIQRTLETILPPLVTKQQQAEDQVGPVFQVFVNALYHIPKHRRLRLFQILVSTLGAEEYLAKMVQLLLSNPDSQKSAAVNSKSAAEEPILTFAGSLLNQYPPNVQIRAMIAISDAAHERLTLQLLSNSTQARTLCSWMECISTQLSDQFFLSRLANRDASHDRSMQERYLLLVEALLQLLNHVQTISSHPEISTKVKACGQALLEECMTALDKVIALLSTESFVDIMGSLVRHTAVPIRRKALLIVNGRLQNTKAVIRETPETLLKLVPMLVQTLEDGKETSMNKQNALLAVGLLCRLFGKDHSIVFVEFLPALVGKNALQAESQEVQLSSLTCLVAIVETTGPRTLAHLKTYLSVLLKLLETLVHMDHDKMEAAPELFIALSVLKSIVMTLPQFLSPYLPKILDLLFSACLHEEEATSVEVRKLVQDICDEIASRVAPRILLTPLFSEQASAAENGAESLCAYFDLVGKVISLMKRDAIATYYKQLFKFYLSAFDIRSTFGAKTTQEVEVEEVESRVISSFTQLVLKLNESMFKPLFLKMVDWSTTEPGSNADLSAKRTLFFYKAVDALLAQLKSIFAPYYAHVLDHAIEILSSHMQDKTWSPLWSIVVSTVEKALRYDQDQFLGDEKLESLLPSLVDQLSLGAEDEEYMVRVETIVIPALVAFTKSAPLLKKLNHAVLMKTRDDHDSVRLASLLAIQRFYEEDGVSEELLQHLPETIPFLSEVLEDGSEVVERKGREVIATIEKLLGESIQPHLR